LRIDWKIQISSDSDVDASSGRTWTVISLKKISKYINVAGTTAELELVKLQLKWASDMESRVQQEKDKKPGTNFPCERNTFILW